MAAWSMMRWHSSGQSCIKPSMGVPPEFRFVLKALDRIYCRLSIQVKTKTLAPRSRPAKPAVELRDRGQQHVGMRAETLPRDRPAQYPNSRGPCGARRNQIMRCVTDDRDVGGHHICESGEGENRVRIG